MGFNIGGFFKSVVRSLAPAVGTVFGGPVGRALGTALSQSLAPRPSFASQVGPTAVRFGRVLPLIGRAAGRAVGRIDRRKAALLARELGISAAAIALGITAVELAELLVSAPRRRRRGITAAQISTTKATIRRVNSLNVAIAKVCAPAQRRRRRAPSRAAIHHAT